jgi:hypothetical protein
MKPIAGDDIHLDGQVAQASRVLFLAVAKPAHEDDHGRGG